MSALGHGAHLWADRYDLDLTDIFAVQDEVTRQIVDALKVKPSRTSAIGPKQTCASAMHMSAFGGKADMG